MKRFGGEAAVDRLSFSCAPGEMFGFVGPDGAGKTTIMRLLAGGDVARRGRDRHRGRRRRRRPGARPRHVSYMPQRFGLYEDLTVDENIAFFADLFGIARKDRDERAERGCSRRPA